MHEVSGQYVGNYGGAVEMLTLNTNGNYSQILQKGGMVLYTNTGKWSLDSYDEMINFTNFIIAVDLSNSQLINNSFLFTLKPHTLSVSHFECYPSKGKVFLVGAPDTLYFLEKSKPERFNIAK